MKKFNEFIAEARTQAKNADIDQGVVVDGVPSVYVEHGQHSVETFKPEVEHGKIVNGVPAAVIFHGGHSTDSHRKLKEAAEDDYMTRNDNRHIAPSEESVGKHLSNLQKREGLDTHHINSYTGGSRILNKALYQAHANGEKAPTEVRGFTHTHEVKKLDQALSRNKLPSDLHVFSGVGFDPSLKAAKHPEHHLHLPAYTSTSIKKSVARNFAANQGNEKPELQKGGVKGHILHIHLPKGHAGAYIDKESNYQGEKEFLLPRATTIKIRGHSDHRDEFDDVYRVHHAMIVPTSK